MADSQDSLAAEGIHFDSLQSLESQELPKDAVLSESQDFVLEDPGHSQDMFNDDLPEEMMNDSKIELMKTNNISDSNHTKQNEEDIFADEKENNCIENDTLTIPECKKRKLSSSAEDTEHDQKKNKGDGNYENINHDSIPPNHENTNTENQLMDVDYNETEGSGSEALNINQTNKVQQQPQLDNDIEINNKENLNDSEVTQSLNSPNKVQNCISDHPIVQENNSKDHPIINTEPCKENGIDLEEMDTEEIENAQQVNDEDQSSQQVHNEDGFFNDVNNKFDKSNETSIKEVNQELNNHKTTDIENLEHSNDLQILEKSPKSRNSVEVLYNKPKSTEYLEISEDTDEIVLDSSTEVSEKIRSGPITEILKIDEPTSDIESLKPFQEPKSDILSDSSKLNGKHDTIKSQDSDNVNSLNDEQEIISRNVKTTADVVTVSDSDSSFVDSEAIKSKALSDPDQKVKKIEKEVNFNIKIKYLLHVDDNTKDIYHKELLSCICDSNNISSIDQHRNVDSSSGFADVSSDNKEHSPGSVTSNPAFKLNNRFSIYSVASSSSSSSSAPSINKNSGRDKDLFSIPQEPLKSKKNYAEHLEDRQNLEIFEKLNREWKNSRSVIDLICNTLNESALITAANGGIDLLEDHHQKLRDHKFISSSTPEIGEKKHPQTPKSSRKGRVTKRSRTKNTKLENSLKNAINSESGSSKKKTKLKSDDLSTNIKMRLNNSRISESSDNFEIDDLNLLNKEVFARWSDNKYYPGVVKSWSSSHKKYKVRFYDNEVKELLPDFIVLVPEDMVGKVVHTISDNYELPGVIVEVEKKNNELVYLIDTEQGKIESSIQDMFLTAEQAKLLKEDTDPRERSAPPTPSHIDLENVVNTKRRSKRTTSPKSKKSLTYDRSTVRPSSSGNIRNSRRNKPTNEDKTSDSNISVSEAEDLGLQNEIVGTAKEQTVKGPIGKIKSRSRGRRKQEPDEITELLGPIPEEGSEIFKDIHFILSCVSKEDIDRYKYESELSSSEVGTENEEEWLKRPFERDRLQLQIIAGGGTYYQNFEDIPPEYYSKTMHITNLPNRTRTSLLCLSVGIRTYKHDWIILSCQNNKAVVPESEELPLGWSIESKKYIEAYKRGKNNPLECVVIAIPDECGEEFVPFWQTICQNAGAKVQVISDPGTLFMEATAVVTNNKCPAWVFEKSREWDIPVYSTTWVVQCLIEGKTLNNEAIKEYKIPSC